ncbi:hypothetical protein [Rhodopseudomonas palustris]|uniref:Uncharacterized protein n=1 Tax=Rhodopseudomonas palustris TaxID=1076 RepID=A0A418VE25_RHOPL|nr:hypothetical protein [Rhodopseudomonas palustris]RJF74352.1 hypothetical protein D4Q52_12740 [Rhodopseudomonas palustris]
MIKAGATLTVGSIAIAVGYAVALSKIYPSVPIDGGVVTLCAFAGVATALGIAGLWRLVRGARPT